MGCLRRWWGKRGYHVLVHAQEEVAAELHTCIRGKYHFGDCKCRCGKEDNLR